MHQTRTVLMNKIKLHICVVIETFYFGKIGVNLWEWLLVGVTAGAGVAFKKRTQFRMRFVEPLSDGQLAKARKKG